jgi:hypothetical protein
MKPDFLTPAQWDAVFKIQGWGKARRTLARRMGRGFLECRNCRKRQSLTTELVERYLSEGWPQCCAGTAGGGTMSYYASEAQFEKELLATGGK